MSVLILTSLHPFPAAPRQGKPLFPLAIRACSATSSYPLLPGQVGAGDLMGMTLTPPSLRGLWHKLTCFVQVLSPAIE